jgi:hypothetical protein
MEQWPKMKAERTLYRTFDTKEMADNHTELFDVAFDNVDGYGPCDAIWQYSILANNGKTILPKNNLVKHTGFGEESMHNEVTPYFQKLMLPDLEVMSFPLTHPDEVSIEEGFERRYYKYKEGRKIWLLSWLDRARHTLIQDGAGQLLTKGLGHLYRWATGTSR